MARELAARCQIAWFTSGKRATRYQTQETVLLDGARITIDEFTDAVVSVFREHGVAVKPEEKLSK
ncbi:hypothetical protein ABZ214_37145 [Streptomyces iakyrus]|uniref:hypothetical protein n=1 Tax=Streptomyces iakyrus TaxID=68219 RepID=UPI0033BA0955